MAQPTAADRFFMNVDGLYSLILELVTSSYNKGIKTVNPVLIQLGKGVLASFSHTEIINGFIGKSHLYWSQIKNKEDSFFINHASDVFIGLPLDNVNAFRDLFTKKIDGEDIITADDKDTLYEYFECLIRVSISYMLEDPKRNKWGLDLEALKAEWLEDSR